MGHIAPNCKVKEIIADLDIGKFLKKQMINLIKTDSDSSSQSSEFSNNQFFLLEDSTSSDSNSSSSQSSCDCVGNCLCQIHQVNMISSENNFLIEIIENIPDPNLQKEYFKKFLEIQKQRNQKKLENNNEYSLKTVLDKFSNKPKIVGIQELVNLNAVLL